MWKKKKNNYRNYRRSTAGRAVVRRRLPAPSRRRRAAHPTAFAFTLHARRTSSAPGRKRVFCTRGRRRRFRLGSLIINIARVHPSMVADCRCSYSISHFSRNGVSPTSTALQTTVSHLAADGHVVPRASTDRAARRRQSCLANSHCTRAAVCVRAFVQQLVHAIAAKTETRA